MLPFVIILSYRLGPLIFKLFKDLLIKMNKISRATATVCFALISMLSSAQNNNTVDAKSDEFIKGLAELMAHSLRAPILRTPDQYGMQYEDIFFPAIEVLGSIACFKSTAPTKPQNTI
jgi:hypothetical protein